MINFDKIYWNELNGIYLNFMNISCVLLILKLKVKKTQYYLKSFVKYANLNLFQKYIVLNNRLFKLT